MKTRILYSVLFAFLGCFSIMAQTGEIEGRLLDDLGEGVPFADVVLYKGTDLLRGVQTDLDGQYLIEGLDAGTYNIEARFVGYATQRQEGVIVSSGIIRIDFLMTEGITLDDIVVVGYKVPLIQVDETETGGTLTGEDIKNLPIKDIGGLVGATSGVASSGNDVNVKGSRTDATVYILDGVRVSGTLPPQTEIEQLQVITGGLSAKYGDVTGGVISLTSKGPSSRFSGGLELETSEGLDPYGYNLINGNVSGPILKKDDQSIIGFRLSGQYRKEADNGGTLFNSNPSAVGVYRLPEEEIRNLENSPFIRVGTTPLASAESVDPSLVQLLDARPNDEYDRLDVTGKIDARLSDNIDIQLSGTYVDESDRFVPTNTTLNYYGGGAWALFNHINNPLETSNRYRGNFRFRHRLGGSAVSQDDSEKKNSVIENISYTLQFGYEKFSRQREDIRHGENFFNHGYIGKFETSFAPDAGILRDSGAVGLEVINPQNGIVEIWGQTGYTANLESYTPGTLNAPLANQNNFFADQQNRFDEYLWFNGADESTLSPLWFDLFNNVGTVYNRFRKTEFDRYSVNVNSSFNLYPGKSRKSRHNIEFGFNYEQRVNRFWNIRPQRLWTTARDRANIHLADIDTTMIIGTFDQVVYGNVLTFNQYERNIQPTVFNDPDARFFRNIREQLNVGVREIVDVDALSPDQLSLDLFSAGELNDRDLIEYYGFDYLGNKLPSGTTYNDFFTATDANGARTFPIAALEPIYWGAYVQDKFSFKDVIFKVGVRVDRFDANTKVLKDPNSLYEIKNAKDFFDGLPNDDKPAAVGDDYLVYTGTEGGNDVVGYRVDQTWYNTEGSIVNSANELFRGNIVRAALKNPNANIQDPGFNPDESFKDYEPEVKILPRIAVSFPISDEANFFAHYDVLVQRPSFLQTNATQFDYYYFERESGLISNPDLKPQTTIDYEIGFKQKISSTAAITIGAYYKELRDNIQQRAYFNLPLSTQNRVSEYTTYDNIDFGTTKGFTFQLDMRRTNNLKVNVGYTLAFADGTGSGVNSSAGLTQNEVIRTLSPLTFDERHALTVITDYRFSSGNKYNGPNLFGANIFANMGLNLKTDLISGRPYTAANRPSSLPATGGNGFAGTVNGARQPWIFKIDGRLDKDFTLTKPDAKNRLGLNVYLRVTNLLGTDNVRFVYDATGSAADDGFLASEEGQRRLKDFANEAARNAYEEAYSWGVLQPGYYFGPRRIFLGAIFSF